MAALFQGIVSNMPFTTKPEPQQASPEHSLIQSPRSYHMPAYPMASEWDERQARASTGAAAMQGRIAHWDKKREKCQNCKHIYLKTLSRHPGFCSVDCKSNAAYLDKVNKTINAVRSAVEQMQQDKEAEQDASVDKHCQDDNATSKAVAIASGQAHTFAEYGIESRMRTEQNVEWAFSAMY